MVLVPPGIAQARTKVVNMGLPASAGKQFQATGDSIQASGHAKAILGEAEAQARANRLLAESITPTLVQYELAKRWNGEMPQVTGSAMPMIQLPKAATSP